MKLTADTITDEQIRELQRVPWLPGDPDMSPIAMHFRIGGDDYAADALNPNVPRETRRFARARCAEILNARGAK